MDWLQLIFLPILYAETHYRFKYFFSYLKKREPEIIADIPSRITHGMAIPVLIIIKDADKYPVLIKAISVSEKKQAIYSQELNKNVSVAYEEIIVYVNSRDLSPGSHHLDIKISYASNNTTKYCFADNYRGTSHKPLPLFISTEFLPRFNNCFFGETHSHTNYTSDQVEFGASLEATRIMSQAMGLDFFCATDHSYDLDDEATNYLKNDPELKKWENFKNKVNKLNSNHMDVIIIPGEEVSVRNNEGKNVHVLIYNSDQFFPGTGDSGEKWFKNYSELSISEIVSQIHDSSLALSAHPSEKPPFLQKLFINRGSWTYKDCSEKGLNGLQFINGGDNCFIESGRKLWIEQLLEGNRLTGIAGNDAHGNFSRFRQVRFPFFTMRENYTHLFGKWRTGIYFKKKNRDIVAIMDAIRSGNCFMTNGPALLLEVYNSKKSYSMGEKCSFPVRCLLKVRSTDEFDDLNTIMIIIGDLDKKQEFIYYEKKIKSGVLNYHEEIALNNIPDRGYLRMEVSTVQKYQALSNPIWF